MLKVVLCCLALCAAGALAGSATGPRPTTEGEPIVPGGTWRRPGARVAAVRRAPCHAWVPLRAACWGALRAAPRRCPGQPGAPRAPIRRAARDSALGRRPLLRLTRGHYASPPTRCCPSRRAPRPAPAPARPQPAGGQAQDRAGPRALGNGAGRARGEGRPMVVSGLALTTPRCRALPSRRSPLTTTRAAVSGRSAP